ncbi:ribonuclease J [Dongia mobilis]|uniref:Ribonuclease J n=1 Tax=Dongia mobilis TaxID=578943 RepID=A0A4R6WJI7_9PROT|nr:ribonuclease J [Dongia mobilis]TDQ80535.1 ribonuclease J [Dongia mobilis]
MNSLSPRDDELLFLPLGGSGEIGMNLNLYGHAGKWLMVDLGISFGDDSVPGIDVVMPDPQFIDQRSDDLVGIVLTHAHEDHIGAVPYLWPRLRCPLYATPFTASVLKRKLAEAGLEREAKITIIPMSGKSTIGPFEVELITLTHSIPEPNAVVIRTPLGAVLHTGDWKLDPEPLVGPTTDEVALRALGQGGVLAMICDSTNVFVEGTSGSEADVRASLMELVGRLDNRVAIGCFASNLARVETIAKVAEAHGRHCALVGRSLWRMVEAAQENGYLTDLPPFVDEHDVGYFPRENVLMICTGSQGEPRSALTRIARGEHPHVTLEPGDSVIFSSRVIPGNELSINRLQNDLTRRGIEVITDRDEHVHVSGHPARDELAEMYHWVRPRVALPVHGEARHIQEHVKFAKACQVPEALAPENGMLIRLAPGPVETVARVPSGRLALDGKALVPADSEAIRHRHRMSFNGVILVSLVVDHAGKPLVPAKVSLDGLLDEPAAGEAVAAIAEEVADAMEGMPRTKRGDDSELAEAVRLAARRWFHRTYDKKPITKVHLIRV